MMEVTFTLKKQRERDGRLVRAREQTPSGARIPRLSRLMALAIRFEGLIRDGAVPDQVTLSRTGGVTRSRLTQIMHLVHLAPDIQEELLFLPGSSRIVERTIRPVVRFAGWDEQRRAFEQAKRQREKA